MISIGYGSVGVNFNGGYCGGTELGAERLVNWLKNRGVDVDVIASGSQQTEYDVYMFRGFLWWFGWFFSAFYKSIIAIRNNPDIIYARFATFPLFLGVILKFIYGKKLIVSVHGGDMRKRFIVGKFIDLLLSYSDAVVCYDNPNHIKRLKNVNSNVCVIPNGVDVGRFIPINRNKKIKRVMYFGGERKIKGFYDVLRLSKVDDLWREGIFELHIYGVDKEKSEGGVFFHKYVNNNELPNIMRKGDLLILPSYAEGVPTVLLEAMACGMYVVCSDLDYTRKVVDFCYLFKAGDINTLIFMIEMYDCSDVGFFYEQSAKNIKLINLNYSMDIVGEKWLVLLKKILEV